MMPASAKTEAGLFRAALLRRRNRVDRWARYAVTCGGYLVIASILAILGVILVETVPLFRAARVKPGGAAPAVAPGPVVGLGVDEYRRVAWLAERRSFRFFALSDGAPLGDRIPEGVGDAEIVSLSPQFRAPSAVGLSDGRVLPVSLRFDVTFDGTARKVAPMLETGKPIDLLPHDRPVRDLAFARTPDGAVAAALSAPHEVQIVRVTQSRSLLGDGTQEEARSQLALPAETSITSLCVDDRGESLYLGTKDGRILAVDLRAAGAPSIKTEARAFAEPPGAIVVLAFLLGDRTFVAGDERGRLSSWQLLVAADRSSGLSRVHEFTPHSDSVQAVAASSREKSFLSASRSGEILLHHGTTGSSSTAAHLKSPLRAVAFAPKADGFMALGQDGTLRSWNLDNPHPEITVQALFGKLQYEGYPTADSVWQSTGGTDDFEPKLSLVPLIFGTLKGTFYALLFAVPVALLAALYASQFLHPSLKAIVKPTVELMAALPSVVLGFIAGLWLAPTIEKVVPGLFLMPWVIIGLTLVSAYAWHRIPLRIRQRFRAGSEIFLLVPIVLGGAALAFQLGYVIEAAFLGGDYRPWLQEAFGITYDQRNCVVVGVAMGFAVVPIIFTIAEDSLSIVPQGLAAGSLALGATRWQTAVRVIIPTASPGIFSAIMIGFGRAVGETMIVLMATGNTPTMDLSIFNGFRALSANIAVELPEAPEGGTLYRTLFLAALLLFFFTFAVNTVAEMIRLQLRKRYRVL